VDISVDIDAADFDRMWDDLQPVGRNPSSGGYRRFVWDDADRTMREWFAGEAAARGLDLHVDRNGNQWAWWGDPTAGDALVLGSHLDSVPEGGAYDGPLGVVSAFAALDAMRTAGLRPGRPVAVVSFVDEEGARFGVPCAGSRLLTGTLAPGTARALRDREGRSMDEVLRAAGRRPDQLGRDDEVLARVGTFVELHVEQGRDLVHRDRVVGVGSEIWPHGRYRFDISGEANHAGTTEMEERRDPMLTYAATALTANEQARRAAVRATFGRVEVEPGGTNAVPSSVRAWMDARAGSEAALHDLVEAVKHRAQEHADDDGTSVAVTTESASPATRFDEHLAQRLSRLLGDAPIIPTGAGHDAGVLALAGVPTAMLFVRNPTGVSHSPAEYAERADCLAGVEALAATLADLAG
jgi:beta-ureidopropionase / N-carbamoyl-L-amino-acid hydrolase